MTSYVAGSSPTSEAATTVVQNQIAVLIKAQETWAQALVALAVLTAETIPGADGAGVALMNGLQVEQLAASSIFASDIDAIQYEIGEGPCLTAVAEGRTISSGQLGRDETRWPEFGLRSQHLELRSVLSLPLMVGRRATASLNIYAHAASAFDEQAVARGEQLARSAAVAVQNARALHSAEAFATRFEVALRDQAVLTVAIALLQESRRLSVADAYAFLEERATTLGQTTAAAAAAIIAETTEGRYR